MLQGILLCTMYRISLYPTILFVQNSKHTKKNMDTYTFENQYYKLYKHRLSVLSKRIVRGVHGSGVKIYRNFLKVPTAEQVMLIGTIVKDMKNSVDFISLYTNAAGGRVYMDKRACSTDKIYLEDDASERVFVEGVDAGHLVQGIVCGIVGTVVVQGDGRTIRCREIVYPGFQGLNKARTLDSGGVTCCVVLVSGLRIDQGPSRALDDLFAHVRARHAHLVVAGGTSMPPPKVDYAKMFELRGNLAPPPHKPGRLASINKLCKLIREHLPDNTVRILPDANMGPYPQTLPPRSVLGSPSNVLLEKTPCEFTIENVRLMGMIGRSVDNIRTNSTLKTTDIMHSMLMWNHCAPTCPSSITCCPLDVDPLIMNDIPHIIFVGNQPLYESVVVPDGPLLLSLPIFADTGIAFEIELDSFSYKPIKF